MLKLGFASCILKGVEILLKVGPFIFVIKNRRN